MSERQIQQEVIDNKGAFFIAGENKRLASMTYTQAGPNRIIIDHTEVEDELRGTGAGKSLVLAAVAWARENNIKILPLCPFARSVFQKNPEINDVLD